jgi:hypothetical protein
MPLSWNEIKTRATAFAKTWQDASNEDSEAKPFLIDFFEVFGITNKRLASFEQATAYCLIINNPLVDKLMDNANSTARS